MAQPTQYHPPYASPHSTPSPMTPGANQPFAPPPTKRPHMSPTTPTGGFHQPAHSPSIPNGNNAGYNPYAQQNTNPYPLPPQNAPSLAQPPVHHTPPPHGSATAFQQPPQQTSQAPLVQAQGTMGPPQKPEENKNPDLNDIADVMHGVGVNLKEEEAYLAQHGRRNTNYPHAGQPGVFDPQRNTLQANVPGGRDSFYGAGSFNQPLTTEQNLEDELEAKERLQKRRRAEREQFHNNEPFLLQNVVLAKINTHSQKNQTQVDMSGVYKPQPNTTNKLAIIGPEGSESIVTLTRENLLNLTSPMGDVLALISLAARERIRMAVEDSGALARSRRTTSHGIVPPDFQDIAVGEGKTQEAIAEPTPIIGAGSPSSNRRKRSHSQANDLPTPVSDVDASERLSPQPTISFEDRLAKEFQRRAEEEEKWEEERLAKRAKRATQNLVSSGTGETGSRTGSVSGTPAPGTPGGPVDGMAPDVSKMTKKEQKKKQEAEAASSSAINTKNAVSMALGGKKLSWMTGGKGSGGAAPKRPIGPPAKKADKPAATVAGANAGMAAAKGAKNLGGFREDREGGKGIQIRDLVNALKEHNPEKFTLSKAFNRLEPRQ